MCHRRCYAFLIRLLVLLFGISSAAKVLAQATDDFSADTITLGIVATSHQQEIIEHFRPFISYVSAKVFVTPKARGKVRVASSLPELAKLLDQREVDFFMESSYPTYVINQVHDAARLLLRRWKGGMAEYRSLIITAKDGGINKIANLQDRNIAFEDPESTSGYFLPKFFLQRNGLKLTPQTPSSSGSQPGAVQYIFAGSTEKILDLVLAKQVAAGAISDDDFAGLAAEKRVRLNIVAQTDLLPRHLVSVRKDLSAAVSQRLAQILQAMNENDEGRKILLDLDNTTKFDPLPGGEEAMRRRLLDTFFDRPRN